MAVKHRCGFCRKVLRADGTCQNQSCPRYVPEVTEDEQPKHDSATDTNVGGK